MSSPSASSTLPSSTRLKAALTVVGWLLLCLTLFAIGRHIGAREEVPGPSSPATLKRNQGEVIARDEGIPLTDTVVIMLTSTQSGFWRSEQGRSAVQELVRALRTLALPDPAGEQQLLFRSVTTRGHTLLREIEDQYLSSDEYSLLVRAESTIPVSEASLHMPIWRLVVDRWREGHPSVSVHILSLGLADEEVFSLINSDLDQSLIITIPLTLAILLYVFRTWCAAILPLGIALTSLVAALGSSAMLSHLWHPISVTADQLVVLLVLAVGIDYALFMISRYREEYQRSGCAADAIEAARRATTPAILWAGMTVALSLSGLLLMRDSVLTSMAAVAMGAVLIAMIGSSWVLPALLQLIPARFIIGVAERTDTSAHSSNGRITHPRWITAPVTFALTHPWKALAVSVAPLLVLVCVSTKIELGSSMERHLLPQSMQLARAHSLLAEQWPSLAQSELHVLLWSRPDAKQSIQELEEAGELQPFFDKILSDPAINQTLVLNEISDSGRIIRYRIFVQGTANDPKTQKLARRIRDELAPQMLAPRGVSLSLSGNLGYVVGETERYSSRTPSVIAAVLLLSMTLLLIAFRSIVIPVKAVLLNLLSVGCSFGVLVLIFQWSSLPGMYHGVIESFVPALLFSILFGLSMDYHVFLLARIREEYRISGKTTDSVQRGIFATYRTISGAAAIMAAVFLVIGTLELPVMRQLGVGLAIAVVLDATIIRLVILPASMVLLGRYNWYFPGRNGEANHPHFK